MMEEMKLLQARKEGRKESKRGATVLAGLDRGRVINVCNGGGCRVGRRGG